MNKSVVATVCVVVSAGAIAGGLWLRSSTAPLALPTTSEEAIEGMTSEAYAKMDAQRRRQYVAEAMKLMRDMSPEERRAMRERFGEDEEMREAMDQARQDMFDEIARRAARGMPMQRPEAPSRRERPNPDEMTDEQREQMRERMEAMRERMTQAMKDSWDSGDAQSSGLRQEMFKNRGGGGGGRRGGGG